MDQYLKERLKKLVPIFSLVLLLLVAGVTVGTWNTISEYALVQWYERSHPEFEVLNEAPAGYQEAQIVGGAFGVHSPKEESFWFSYESWYDEASGSLYYVFDYDGQKKLFVHSKLFPMLFGWKHLEMDPGQTLYVRIPNVGLNDWDWREEMASLDSTCPQMFSFSTMPGSIALMVPSQ